MPANLCNGAMYIALEGSALQEKNIHLNWEVAAICEAYQYYTRFTNGLYSIKL